MLNEIDFVNIASAVGSNPHSRRMAGAMIALQPDFPGCGVLADKCWSKEFKSAVGRPRDQAVVAVFLERGALPARRVCDIASLAGTYNEEKHRNDTLYDNVLLALGSPLIGNDAKTLYAHGFLTSELRDCCIGRNALLGNPLIHGMDGKVQPDTRHGHYVFLQNAAQFGNFDNPNLARAIIGFLGKKGDRLDASIIFDALLSREKLPGAVLTAMSCSPMTTAASTQRLVLREDHRQLVRGGSVDGVARFPEDDGDVFCVASPDTSAERMNVEFSLGGETRQLSLLNSGACPRTIYQNLLAGRKNLLGAAGFLTHSPFASEYVAGFKPGEFWPAFRDGYLDGCGDEGEQLMAISLPNIPFDQISPICLRDDFQGNDILAANIVGAIRSRAFAESLGPVSGDAKTDLALLFSPHTSGRQLEKIAKLHPEAASLAACHPNGSEVDVPKI